MNGPGQSPATGARCLVVIGASTGGTQVVTEMLRAMPPLPACIVIVQHMPKFINASLARTLSRNAAAPVRIIEEGDRVGEGGIFLAPSEVHCTLVNNRSFHLATGPKVNFVCPSIDVTMRSLVPPLASHALVGVLLTGMGEDGAAGLAHMKQLGALTLAQNQATCAVYGMPAKAVKLGCVDRVLPPGEIARVISRCALRRAPMEESGPSGVRRLGTILQPQAAQ
jgi:two-component system chemotaxis response regulator CheB